MTIRPHIQKLASDLKEAGVRYAFGVTGGGASLELITQLMQSGIEYTPVSHEAAAPIMAGATAHDGVLRAVSISIKGPGFVNQIPGITLNQFENRPTISIAEAYDPEITVAKVHKKVDQETLAKPITKTYAVYGENTSVEGMVKCAQSEIPGPVHIDLCNEPSNAQVQIPEQTTTYTTTQDWHEKIAAMQKPVLILGSLAARKLQNVDWASFSIPVCTTAAAKGTIDETGDYVGGVITGEIKELSPETTIIGQADGVIAIGLRQGEVVKPMEYDKPTLIIDTITTSHDGFGAETIVVKDIQNTIADLKTHIQSDWGKDVCEQARKKIEAEVLKHAWVPATTLQSINSIASESTLALDTGLFCTIGETVFQAQTPEHFIGTSQGRFMGTAIPTAIGCAIHTKRKTICMMGDGGVIPYISEIAVAVEKRLPILFMLMADGGYGTIAMGAEPKQAPTLIYEHAKKDVQAQVRALGCKTEQVDSKEAFEEVLTNWMNQDSPLFVELPFNKEHYRTMTQKIR